MDIRQDNNSFIRHYGLQHNPFSTASSFQFFRARRREVLEQLIHFARYSQLMLAVTGPRGSGKTVLRHAVVAASKETALNVVVSALKNSDAAGIAQQLAYALQCSNADVMSLLHAVEQSVLAGKEVQLLVDDAEVLDGSALALLQRLAAGSGKTRCRVFLFGEPALQTLLQAVDSADGFEYHLVELEPWQSEEVEEYLQQRLQAAGQDLDLFTDQELGILLERGQGWPGVINQLAQELLLARMQGEQLEPASASPRRTMPALPYRHLLALLVTAFLFVFAWYQLDDSESKQPAAEPAGLAQGQAAAQPQRRVMLDIQPGEPVDAPARQVQQPARPAPAEPQAPVISETAPGPAREEAMAVAPEPPAVAKETPAASAPASGPQPAATPKTQPQPAARAKPRVAAAVAERRAANGDNWYAAQPAQSYTLQLFATASEQNARQFVQANGNQFHYFRKIHQGQQLFVVTHGRFDNAAAARSAAERLPESIRRNKPWPRTFASIRQEMR